MENKIVDKENFYFKKYGNFDVSSVIDKVRLFTKEQWNDFTFRQDTYDVHSETLTIPLRYNSPNENGIIQSTTTELFYEFNEFILNLEKSIQDLTKLQYKILNCNFVNLPAGKKVWPHRDAGQEFLFKRRMHLPIITNDDVLFTVDNETINMKAGEIWEVNNSSYFHSVYNNGTTDRVHFLFDIKVV
jgi:hypothetical protein